MTDFSAYIIFQVLVPKNENLMGKMVTVQIMETGCMDTSACQAFQFTSLWESPTHEFRAYPNPSNGNCYLEVSGDLLGNVVEVFALGPFADD